MNAWLRVMEDVFGSEYHAKEKLKTLSIRERQAAKKARKRAVEKYALFLQELVRRALVGKNVDPADVLILQKAGLLWQSTVFRQNCYHEHCYTQYSLMKDGIILTGFIGFDRSLNLVMVDVRSPETHKQTKVFELREGVQVPLSRKARNQRLAEAEAVICA